MTEAERIVPMGSETQDKGAFASEPGSQASPQAPAGLGPSGFDPSRVYVGQRLWLVYTRRNSRPEPVEVASIGRKWVTITAAGSNRQVGRFALGDPHLDGGNYISPGKLYGSEEEHALSVARDERWGEIRRYINGRYARPEHLDAERLALILQLLRDSDGSPKGGDANAAPFTTARAEGIAPTSPPPSPYPSGD